MNESKIQLRVHPHFDPTVHGCVTKLGGQIDIIFNLVDYVCFRFYKSLD